MPRSHARRRILIVSDGTGRTGQQVVQSVLTQFEEVPLEIVVRPGIRSARAVHEIVKEARETGAIIFFTLVADKTRAKMKDYAASELVEAVDVLDPVLRGLSTIVNKRDEPRPGEYYRSERVYFDRIDAIDYTLKHDDGQRVRGLGQADVVLVGVSRASKSSTCFYLAYRGIRAANVPLLPGVAPPPELLRLSPKRVIGLSVNAGRLAAIRLARAHLMGADGLDQYVAPSAIEKEVLLAQRLMNKHGWTKIDISYMAIEEIARRVMDHMDEQKLRRRSRSRTKR